MSESKNLTIIPKIFTKEYLLENSSTVFRNRELVIEKESDGVEEHTIFRFKIGDGLTPYKNLKYISSMYSLLPEICLCNKDYSSKLIINFNDKEE